MSRRVPTILERRLAAVEAQDLAKAAATLARLESIDCAAIIGRRALEEIAIATAPSRVLERLSVDAVAALGRLFDRARPLERPEIGLELAAAELAYVHPRAQKGGGRTWYRLTDFGRSVALFALSIAVERAMLDAKRRAP